MGTEELDLPDEELVEYEPAGQDGATHADFTYYARSDEKGQGFRSRYSIHLLRFFVNLITGK